MLILSRKAQQSVLVRCGSHEFVIHVNEVGRGCVKLAFDAPVEVEIIRSELLWDRAERDD